MNNNKMNSIDLMINNLFEKNVDEKYWENYLIEKEKEQKEKKKPIISKYKKVLVVPYIKDENGATKIMTVFNRKYNEWGVISGTIEKGESFIKAATRELFEETKCIVNINFETIPDEYIKTIEIFETQKNEKYTRKYTAVLIRVPKFFVNLEKLFYQKKMQGYEYNENEHLKFQTIEEIKNKKNIWRFLDKKLFDNFYFQHILLG